MLPPVFDVTHFYGSLRNTKEKGVVGNLCILYYFVPGNVLTYFFA